MSGGAGRDLRVFKSTVVATGNNPVFSQLLALLQNVEAVEFQLSEPELFKAMTRGQTAIYAVNRFEMAVNHGGFESLFRVHSGAMINAAYKGLKSANAAKFAANLAAATKLLPWQRGWPERDAREEALDKLTDQNPDYFDEVNAQFQACYDGEESLGKAIVAYAFAHPAEFFVDAAVSVPGGASVG